MPKDYKKFLKGQTLSYLLAEPSNEQLNEEEDGNKDLYEIIEKASEIKGDALANNQLKIKTTIPIGRSSLYRDIPADFKAASSYCSPSFPNTITEDSSIAIGRASSYWSQMRPPPAAKATNAGAPKMLFVEHWVAKIETANAPEETPSLVTK